MIIIALALVLISILSASKIKDYFILLKVPGPLLPNGVLGSLPEFFASPRLAGPGMSSKYGPLYRIYTTNMRTVVALADPVLAKQLYQNESNMAHAWDQGIGHFIVRYIGNLN